MPRKSRKQNAHKKDTGEQKPVEERIAGGFPDAVPVQTQGDSGVTVSLSSENNPVNLEMNEVTRNIQSTVDSNYQTLLCPSTQDTANEENRDGSFSSDTNQNPSQTVVESVLPSRDMIRKTFDAIAERLFNRLREEKKRTEEQHTERKTREKLRKQLKRKNPDFKKQENEQRKLHHRKERLNPDFKKQENERRLLLRHQERSDPELKKQDNEKSLKRMREKRFETYENPEYETQKKYKRKIRSDPEYRAKENAIRVKKLDKDRDDPRYRVLENKYRRELHKKQRSDPEYRKRENAIRAKKLDKDRDDPRYRVLENKYRRELHKKQRSDPEYRKRENAIRAKKLDKDRDDPRYRVLENKYRRELHKKQRSDPEYRKRENAIRALKLREERKDVRYRRMENEYKNKHYRKQRLDPDYRHRENMRRAMKLWELRRDEQYRQMENEYRNKHYVRRRSKEKSQQEKERTQVAMRMARLRQDPVYRFVQNQCWKRNQEKKMLNPRYRSFINALKIERNRYCEDSAVKDYLITSQSKTIQARIIKNEEVKKRLRMINAAAQKRRRKGPMAAKIRQTKAECEKKRMAKDPAKKVSHRKKVLESYHNTTAVARGSYTKLLEKYYEKIGKGPTEICACCGALLYQDAMSTWTLDKLKIPTKSSFVGDVTKAKQEDKVAKFCKTCVTKVKQGKVPRLCLSNGLDYPVIPQELKDLNNLEERLVALRIPFMQIRLLGYQQQQWGLRGNVVNVDNNLDTCISALPRQFDETSVVQLKFKRRISADNYYLYDKIRPKKVVEATKYLLSTPLYKEANIVLSKDWITKYIANDEVDFIAAEEDRDILEEENPDASNDEERTAMVGAEETLLYQSDRYKPAELHIAPGEGNIPCPFHLDLDAEFLSFLSIYCGQRYNLNKEAKLTYTDIVKSELRRYDRRCAKPEKIFYSFKRSFNEKVKTAFQICLRQKKTGEGNEKLTAGSLRTAGAVEQIVTKDNGYQVFKNIRSSPAYWKEQSKRVVAMVRQLGNCTFFITLSAAETQWAELLVILKKVVDGEEISQENAAQLSPEEKARLIKNDPCTCSRHFDHKYRALLYSLILSKQGIFNPDQVTDYFSRVEYQLRGAPHSHGLYWVKDAPKYIPGNSRSEKECVQFIDQYITCRRDEEGEMESLLKYQVHKHSHTCWKYSRGTRRCRFSYPKPPLLKTTILEPLPKEFDEKKKSCLVKKYNEIEKKLENLGKNPTTSLDFPASLENVGCDYEEYMMIIRSTLRRATVFLKRSPNEAFINSYNRDLLVAWKANLDIQFVLDPYACAKYCVGYIMKSEGGISKLLRAAIEEGKNGNDTIKEKLQKFARILINSSQISAQEAVGFLLGLKNTMSSRTCTYISSSKPTDRISILKPNEELKELPDDSEDVCAEGMIAHYSRRSEKLESICLADYAALYTFTKVKDPSVDMETEEEEEENKKAPKFWQQDQSGYVKKRKERRIIRYRHYSKVIETDNYWKEQILLFVPWRSEEEEVWSGNGEQNANRLMDVIMNNSKPYYYNRELDDTVLANLIHEIETDDAEDGNEISNGIDIIEDELCLNSFLTDQQPKSSTLEKMLPPKMIEEEEYVKLMRSLNQKQRQFVNHVMSCVKSGQTPFNIFLSGGAGVGKSHVITAIVQSMLRLSFYSLDHPEEFPVFVSAPTGKAAFNVFGMTLHSLFKIPPNDYAGEIRRLDDSTANTLRLKLSKTILFIIDEISMVSSRHLQQIDHRLRQIFMSDENFGGKSVLVVGHLRQLPPVAAKYVFQCCPSNEMSQLIDRNPLWAPFQYFELVEIMRQRGDFEFCKALNNMAEGTMDEDDIALINTCCVPNEDDCPKDAIWLFKTNQECEEFNSKIHASMDTEGAMCIASDKVSGRGSDTDKRNLLRDAENFSVKESDGIPFKTYLKTGAIYFITCNIDVSDGLFNGATGTLRFIEFGQGSNSERVPIRAWMEFNHHLIGSRLKAEFWKTHERNPLISNQWVPVERITRSIKRANRYAGSLELNRWQIPLRAANGMTITKSQGSSLPLVVVNTARTTEFGIRHLKLSREMLYVACSRATTKNGLVIRGKFEPPAKPLPTEFVTIEMEKLRANPICLNQRYFLDMNGCRKVYFHNVQHFRTHRDDLIVDANIMASDVLCFVEAHMPANSNPTLRDFQVFNFKGCSTTSGSTNSEGNIIFIKEEFQGFAQLDAPTNYCYKLGRGHCIMTTFKVENINVILTYKHPKYPKRNFLQKLTQILENLESREIILFGDFNINYKTNEAIELKQLMDRFNLSFKLDKDTATTDRGTLIDLCFSNVDNVRASVYDTYYSYHSGICITW